MAIGLYDHQKAALSKMKNGCILCGGVGSGKSRTALAYYFTQHGGSLDPYRPMTNPRDLYIITTARKRDTFEWEGEMTPFLLGAACGKYSNKVVVDSWNNIQKYKKVTNAFFIFDEQRVVGSGAWVKAFERIARRANHWILLSATPGDKPEDYIPVMVANGFYRNKTEFKTKHMIITYPTGKYPVVQGYINMGYFNKIRDYLLVDMPMERATTRHDIYIITQYDRDKYRAIGRTRWDPWKDEPITNASGVCTCWRRVTNEDDSKQMELLKIFEEHPRLIIFYNFNYELEILKSLYYGDKVKIAEWNGHIHQPIPETKSWVYLVQYTAGAEGWNAISTDTIVFFSESYSYKIMEQAAGRINRLNTPFRDLYYYHLRTHAPIDNAIAKALKEKKLFNETRYVDDRKF